MKDDGTPSLRAVIVLLRDQHGPPQWPPATTAFELVLYENIAYLASPGRRRAAFEQLKDEVGTDPTALVAADPAVLERITSAGMLKGTNAEKLMACAQLVLDRYHGDLNRAIAGLLTNAKRVLRAFPGVGPAGADKILLFLGRHGRVSPESNGLRVLVRLGLCQEESSYARTYANSQPVDNGLDEDIRVRQEAHLLLQEHGQTVCLRKRPRCGSCVLRPLCAFARTNVV